MTLPVDRDPAIREMLTGILTAPPEKLPAIFEEARAVRSAQFRELVERGIAEETGDGYRLKNAL